MLWRRFLVSVCSFLFLLITAACGNDEKNTTSGSLLELQSNKISIWGNITDELVTDFSNAYPDLDVSVSSAVGEHDLHKLTAAIIAQESPDIVLLSFNPSTAYYSDLFDPVQSYLEKDPEYKYDDLDPDVFCMVTFNDVIYFSPYDYISDSYPMGNNWEGRYHSKFNRYFINENGLEFNWKIPEYFEVFQHFKREEEKNPLTIPRPIPDSRTGGTPIQMTYYAIPKGAANPAGGWKFSVYDLTSGKVKMELLSFEKSTEYYPSYIFHKPTRDKLCDSLRDTFGETYDIKVNNAIDSIEKKADSEIEKTVKIYSSPVHKQVIDQFNVKYEEMLAGQLAIPEFQEQLQEFTDITIKEFKERKIKEGWKFEDGKAGIPPSRQ